MILTCETDANGTITFNLIKDGVVIETKTNENDITPESFAVFSLTLDEDDRGIYSCSATVSGIRGLSETLSISVVGKSLVIFVLHLFSVSYFSSCLGSQTQAEYMSNS